MLYGNEIDMSIIDKSKTISPVTFNSSPQNANFVFNLNSSSNGMQPINLSYSFQPYQNGNEYIEYDNWISIINYHFNTLIHIIFILFKMKVS